MDWQAAITAYIDYIATVRRLSPHTCVNYQRDLEDLAEHYRQEPPFSLTQHHIRQYANRLHRQGLSSKSLQRKLSSIRRFYDFYIRQRQAQQNPALGVKPPKAARKLPKVMDADQLNQLLNYDADNWFAIRDKAILELLYSSGLRLAEIAGLDLADLDFAQAIVTVTGKGNKQRRLPLGRLAIAALRAWLQVRNDKADGDETAVFVSQQGSRISHRNIQQRLRELGIRRGANQALHPHLMRHSFASHMLESSGDLRAVQELLGHSDISTTQIYTHLDFQHLAKTYDAAHPRAHKK